MRLYQQIQYGRSNVRADDPTASYIGGPASATRQCPLCKESLVTLVQLHIPTSRRSLRVEACNSAMCFRKLFESSKFHFGGDGVIVAECFRADEPTVVPKEDKDESIKVKNKEKPADDWGVTDDGDVGFDDLEAKLAAMESATPKKPQAPKKAESRPVPTENENIQSVLPLMALHSLQEPASRTVSADPRDVGLHGPSNRKIEEMLARYIADEEDQDIVQMLQGSASGNGGGAQETDQDLTEKEMAWLRYTDRLKRCPRQLLRYARGGEPLWSLYVFIGN